MSRKKYLRWKKLNNGKPGRLVKYIQDTLLFGDRTVDWYYIRNLSKDAEEADSICTELIKYLNLIVIKKGKEFTPKELEV